MQELRIAVCYEGVHDYRSTPSSDSARTGRFHREDKPAIAVSPHADLEMKSFGGGNGRLFAFYGYFTKSGLGGDWARCYHCGRACQWAFLSRVSFCSLPTSDSLSWVPPKTVSSRLPLCCLSPRSQSLGLRTRTDISLPSVLPRPRDRRDYDALLIQMMWHTYFKFTPVGQRFGRCVDRFAGVYAANSVNSTPEYNSPFRARQGECGGQISLCDHSRYA